MDEEERGEWYLAKQIAVGILVAAAVIIVGFHIYLALVVSAVGKAAEQVGQQVTVDMQRQSAEMQARFQAQRAEQRRRADQARLDETYANAARMRADADAARADQEASARKAAAWNRFYKPAKKCDNPPDWDTQVACGNAYIKARREFEERWGRGDI